MLVSSGPAGARSPQEGTMETHLPERVQNAYLTGRPGLDDQHVTADIIRLSKTAVAVCGILDAYAACSMGDATARCRVGSWLDSVAVMLRSAGFHVVRHLGHGGTLLLLLAVFDDAADTSSVSGADLRRVAKLAS